MLFIEEGGNIIFANAAKFAFSNMQKAFEGEAERLGLTVGNHGVRKRVNRLTGSYSIQALVWVKKTEFCEI